MAAPASLRELALLHVQVLAKGTGGNTRFKCNYCQQTYTGSQTRQLAHLTGTSGSGVAACSDPQFIQQHREAIKLEAERLERLKSGFKASCSSSQLSTSGSCEKFLRCCIALLIHFIVQILLMNPLPKGSDSQPLCKHWQTKRPLI